MGMRYKGRVTQRMVHPDGRKGVYDWKTGGVRDENGNLCSAVEAFSWNRWLAVTLFVFACASPGPDQYLGEHTERFVFSAPASLQHAAEHAAAEWSWMTGLDVRVDNQDPTATPIDWAPRESFTWYPEIEAYAMGQSTLTRRKSTGEFVSCSIDVGYDLKFGDVQLTVLHEMGHCLSGFEGHNAERGCLMSAQGVRIWCDTDVKHVCSQLDCPTQGETQ